MIRHIAKKEYKCEQCGRDIIKDELVLDIYGEFYCEDCAEEAEDQYFK